LPCFGRVSLGAGSDKDTGQQQITTMRTELLSKHNIHDANDLSIAGVEEVYDAIVNGEANEISGLELSEVPNPTKQCDGR
jgi:glycine betaine/choline ABC-type transport system substrate-binding protein